MTSFIKDKVPEPIHSKLPTNTDSDDNPTPPTLKNQSNKKTFYRETSSRTLRPRQSENDRTKTIV